MDLKKLTLADKILFGGGLAFFLSSFLPWFEVAYGPYRVWSNNGWEVNALWGTIPLLITIAMLVWVGLQLFSSVQLPPEIPQLYVAGGAAVAGLVFIKFILGDTYSSRSWGLFVALLSALAFGYGALQKFLGAGGDLKELKAQMKAKADAATTALKDSTKGPDSQ
jgi:hypothetical protein